MGMNYDNYEDEDVFEDQGDGDFVVIDEGGAEMRFDFLGTIEYHNEKYIVLMPIEDRETGEVVILTLQEDDYYESVEDEKTLNGVFQIFKKKFKNQFNFIDD
jgi:uncharacterized protein YrzB (UPF0473 family)